jgi:hypothetical protein
MSGSFGFAMGVNISRMRFLGVNSSPEVIVDGKATGTSQVSHNSANKVFDVRIGKPFVKGFSVRYFGQLYGRGRALIKNDLFNSNYNKINLSRVVFDCLLLYFLHHP